jgi:hypothetical protein
VCIDLKLCIKNWAITSSTWKVEAVDYSPKTIRPVLIKLLSNCNHSSLLELLAKSFVFKPPFTPNPLFQCYLQSKEILLNLSMKCWNLAYNAQGLKVIIVVVQVGVVKIYVATMEPLRQKERQDETQFTTKIDGF